MSPHIVPTRIYFTIFAILLAFTAITVAAAFIDLGPMNNVVALAIASTKAALVILYFMHVRYSSRLTWLVISGAIAWLAILITFTMADTLTRGWMATLSQ